MANNFTLILDTTGPASPSILIENNSTYATQHLVNVLIGTTDSNTSGYQMKIWGNVDDAYNSNIQSTKELSNWMSFSPSQQVKLASGDGSKTIFVVIRDDVHNESSQASDSITLDTTKPTVTITGPDVSKISKINGKNESSFSFVVSSTPDSTYVEYKVKVVSSIGATHSTGTQIPVTNGSVNMSGSGSFPTTTPINCTINGADLELASSGDGSKIVKVFVKDQAGNWSA
jgi:hypothetical protein